jgi:hypothetical protein
VHNLETSSPIHTWIRIKWINLYDNSIQWYLLNQCLSPLTFWVWNQHLGGVFNTMLHLGGVLNTILHLGGVLNTMLHLGGVLNTMLHLGGVPNTMLCNKVCCNMNAFFSFDLFVALYTRM